jgi:hypothetical protein
MKTGETEIIPVGISGRQNNTVIINWNQENPPPKITILIIMKYFS